MEGKVASDSNPKLKTYIDSFKLHFDLVRNIAKEQNKGLSDFIYIISQRLDCESQYSKDLSRISSLKCRFSLGSLSQAIQAFQANCANRADQADAFVDNSKAEILEPLNILLREQESMNKSYSNQVSKLDKDMKSVHSKLQKFKDKVTEQLKDTEDVLYMCENFRRNPQQQDAFKSDPQVQDKLNIKMGNSLRLYRETLDAYEAYYKYTKEYEYQYRTSMETIMESYQKLEEQKIQAIKDSLQKLLIYETAMEQNYKYDVEHISQIIHEIDIPQNIHSIIEENMKNVEPLKEKLISSTSSPADIPKSPWHRLFEIYNLNYYGKEDFMDYTNVVEETKAHIIRVEDEEYKGHVKEFTEMCRKIFKDLALPDKSLNVPELLKNKKGRLAFLDTLKAFVSSPKVSQEGYKVLAMAMLSFLDRAYQEMEAEQIYQSIGVANQIYWADEANRETLFYAIRPHDVWRDVKFWQRAVKNVLDAEVRIQRNILLRESQKNNRPATIAERESREKGAVFGRMHEIIRVMAECGLDARDIRAIMLNFCKTYHLTIKQIDTINMIVDALEKAEEKKEVSTTTNTSTDIATSLPAEEPKKESNSPENST